MKAQKGGRNLVALHTYYIISCSQSNSSYEMIVQEEHCTKAVTRIFLFFNPFTCILFFRSCLTHSLNMPHNIFDVFEVQQQEERAGQSAASGARAPRSDRQQSSSAASGGYAPCAPHRRDGGATRQRAAAAAAGTIQRRRLDCI